MFGVWVMEEEDAALRREKCGGGEGWKGKRKKATTLGDLQRLIAWLFLGLGFGLHRDPSIVRARTVLP